jgi:hypothetical protein
MLSPDFIDLYRVECEALGVAPLPLHELQRAVAYVDESDNLFLAECDDLVELLPQLDRLPSPCAGAPGEPAATHLVSGSRQGTGHGGPG